MTKLNMLNSWSGNSVFSGRRSAQGYLNAGKASFAVSGSCGAGDENKYPKPSACGSACGASDK